MLLNPLDLSFAVRSSLHYGDHFWSLLSGSPFHANTPYLASSSRLLYATSMDWRPGAREPSCFVISAFRLSANYRRTVSQVGSRVTLVMEGLQGLKVIFAWNGMRNGNDKWNIWTNRGSNQRPLCKQPAVLTTRPRIHSLLKLACCLILLTELLFSYLVIC